MELSVNWLNKKNACIEGVRWFENQELTDGVEVVKALITDDKLDWANWLIVRIMEYTNYVGYAVFAAEQVIDLYEKKYPDDKRPRLAIEAARKCIENPSEENRQAANAAANAAYAAAYAANMAAAYADYAADYAAAKAAANADYAADYAAAYEAAKAAAYEAANAAYRLAEKDIKLKILNYGLSLLESRK